MTQSPNPTAALFDLTGRTALVTGASRGIGRAIAVALAGAGAEIIVTARHHDSLAETVAAVGATGRTCHAIAADAADEAAIDALFAEIAGLGVTPDILINNAGMEQVCPSLDVDAALWDRILDTNLRGAFLTARNFARALHAAGREGAIVNTGSLTSGVGVPTATPYTASKSGLLGMTRALAAEWAPLGIRVNAIGPGYFRTELTEVFYRDDAWQQSMSARIPMGRFGRLEDLGGVCVFLCSGAAAYVTGQILYVDGGYMASI